MLDILSTLSHLSDIGDWPEKLEYEMTELSEEAADRGKRRRIEVADETLTTTVTRTISTSTAMAIR
jgi:hypothetical protein